MKTPSIQGTFLAEIADWYQVFQIADELFAVHEPGHVTFFVYRHAGRALFVDSGLGLDAAAADALLAFLKVQRFDVVCTHTHCDHIGLNHRAEKVYISEAEWRKYQKQNESAQIKDYYEMLKFKAWPPGYAGSTRTTDWNATNFIQDGDEIEHPAVTLKARDASGHTVGSLMYHEEKNGRLFTGDLIYTGAMYLHLPDSSYEFFKASMARIRQLQKQNPALQIWPSHNQLPLPAEYPKIVWQFLEDYENGEPKIYRTLTDVNVFFEEGLNLKSPEVQLTVKRTETTSA